MSAREDQASLGWMPRLVAADPPLPPVFSHAQARAQWLTSDQIRHRVRSGRWERLARGYYRSVPGDVVNSRVRVTTPARTWLDIARTRPLTDALAVGDAAVRARLVEPAVLTERAGALKGIRGCRRAVVAASHVSGLRETPLESGSWAYFVRHGVTLPLMQVTFDDDVVSHPTSLATPCVDVGVNRGSAVRTDDVGSHR